VYFLGWKMLRAVAAPWAVLFLMIPLPVIVFNEIALPLQFLASSSQGIRWTCWEFRPARR